MSYFVASLPDIGSGYILKGEAISRGFRIFVEDKKGKRCWTVSEIEGETSEDLAKEIVNVIQEVLNLGRKQGHKWLKNQILGEPFKNLSEN